VADLEWETDEGESTDVGDNEEESEATSIEESEGNEETDHDVEMDHGVAQDDSPHEETDETSPHAARPRRLSHVKKICAASVGDFLFVVLI